MFRVWGLGVKGLGFRVLGLVIGLQVCTRGCSIVLHLALFVVSSPSFGRFDLGTKI